MNPCSRLTLAGIALAGLLAAYAPMSPAADAPGLEGTAWVLSALPGRTLLPGKASTLRFDDGKASGTDGCNHYAVPYSASGTTLQFGPRGISTQMACPPDVTEQAHAFMAGIDGTRSYRVAQGRLELLAADGTLLAGFTPQAQGLAGTSWRVIGYNNGKQAVTSVLIGTTLSMSFSSDGRVSGSAGCNNYTAAYTLSGATLEFGPAAATRKMCADPTGVMDQEQQFLKALETVATARQEGDSLELRTASGALAVRLTRDEEH
jgi:heat shock protein HslJ